MSLKIPYHVIRNLRFHVNRRFLLWVKMFIVVDSCIKLYTIFDPYTPHPSENWLKNYQVLTFGRLLLDKITKK